MSLHRLSRKELQKIVKHPDIDSDGLLNGLTLSEAAISIVLDNQTEILLALADMTNDQSRAGILRAYATETELWMRRNMSVPKCTPAAERSKE